MMEQKLDNYIEEMKKSNTREEMKAIITKAFYDNEVTDKDFSDLVSIFIPIIENNLGIHIDNYEKTNTSSYQKILELNF